MAAVTVQTHVFFFLTVSIIAAASVTCLKEISMSVRMWEEHAKVPDEGELASKDISKWSLLTVYEETRLHVRRFSTLLAGHIALASSTCLGSGQNKHTSELQ